MDLYELAKGDESDSSYQFLQKTNGWRQQHFLNSMILVALETGHPMISHSLIKNINFHAIVGLHHTAGTYRPCEVHVGDYRPPEFYRVEALMDDFINRTNREWTSSPSVELAARALWEINMIHPFVNGNGRTARAVCYFILCVGTGLMLPGQRIIPELMQEPQYRLLYREALKEADKGNLQSLNALVSHLLEVQIMSASTDPTSMHPV